MLRKVFRIVLTICGMLLGYGVSSYLVRNWDALASLNNTEQALVVIASTGVFGLIFFNFSDL